MNPIVIEIGRIVAICTGGIFLGIGIAIMVKNYKRNKAVQKKERK